MDNLTQQNGIRRIRTSKGLTQSELARLAGVTQQQIARVERYGYGLSRKGWQALATALGCEVWELHIPDNSSLSVKNTENFAQNTT